MMKQTKMRPLICAGTSVRGFLAGTKTQTRRVIKERVEIGSRGLDPHDPANYYLLDRETRSGDPITLEEYGVHFCPYGVVGSQLWVREHWMACEVKGQGIGAQFVVFDDEWDGNEPKPKELRPTYSQFKWGSHAAFHLPRYASRITLELEGVRVERVQDITAADVLAEGVTFPGRTQLLAIAPIVPASDLAHLRGAYGALWDAINKKRGYSFEANPYVFALTVRVIA